MGHDRFDLVVSVLELMAFVYKFFRASRKSKCLPGSLLGFPCHFLLSSDPILTLSGRFHQKFVQTPDVSHNARFDRRCTFSALPTGAGGSVGFTVYWISSFRTANVPESFRKGRPMTIWRNQGKEHQR